MAKKGIIWLKWDYLVQKLLESQEAAPSFNLISYVEAWDEVVEQNLIFYKRVKLAERVIKDNHASLH